MVRSVQRSLGCIFKPVLRERVFLLPKEGKIGEDRVARSYSRKAWALCDGASEGYDGGGWAKDLSRCAIRFSSIQRAVRGARIIRSKQLASGGEADWASVLARQRGSYSTLLRLRVFPRTITVEGVGDTVVFFLKGYEWIYGFPSTESEFFQKDPLLISDRLQDEVPLPFSATIYWREEGITSILLATDALASFLAQSGEEERRRICALLHRGTVGRIQKTLEEEMTNRKLKRDDLSFVWLELRRSVRLRKREW